jgi:eukaryotic-like serine/threonine-protein kinase
MRGPDLQNDRYELRERVGSGANATVWRAVDLETGEAVGIKLLRRDAMNPEEISRLIQEVEILGQLTHPCLVRPFTAGVSREGMPYVVMEWIDGQSLREQLQATPVLALADTLAIVEQICGALVEAHMAGVVHRDVKPENVLLVTGEGRRVKLVDFGTAKRLDPTAPVLTADDRILGTPHYMAPERASGRPVGGAADVYAVAVMTYEMLEGRIPFDGRSPIHIVTQHIKDPPPPMRRVTPEVEQAVAWGLTKDPVQRPSAEQYVEQLTRAARTSSGRGRER